MFCYLGEETAETEYKEFRFPQSEILVFAKQMKSFIFDDHHTEFVQFLDRSVRLMFRKYIAKYAVSFGNSTLKDCTLVYGVTDFGECIGVPLKLDKDHDDLVHLTKKLLLDVSPQLAESLKIDFQELSVDDSQLGPSSLEAFHEQERAYDSWRDSEKNFAKLHREFTRKLRRYKESINEMINLRDIRLELIGYIKDSGAHCPNIIKRLLKFDNHITFRDGQVSREKRKQFCMSYWIVNFRDDRLADVLKTKPCKYSREREPMDPGFMLLRTFRPLIRDILRLGYKFYIITFSMPSNVFDLSYKGAKYVRCGGDGDPYCKRV